MGDVHRAWERLERLQNGYGNDQETDIGAYFYLAGWGVGRESLNQRIEQYAKSFHCNERTVVRRADRGAVKLAVLIRDEAESSRPWGLLTLFQSGAKADVIVRLMLGFESWRPATVRVNGKDVSDPKFTIHRNEAVEGSFYHQIILQKVPLDLDALKHGTMASASVHWPMPVWPTWQTVAYVADPRIVTRTRTFRNRGVELKLEWTRETTSQESSPLMTNQRMWIDRS